MPLLCVESLVSSLQPANKMIFWKCRMSIQSVAEARRKWHLIKTRNWNIELGVTRRRLLHFGTRRYNSPQIRSVSLLSSLTGRCWPRPLSGGEEAQRRRKVAYESASHVQQKWYWKCANLLIYYLANIRTGSCTSKRVDSTTTTILQPFSHSRQNQQLPPTIDVTNKAGWRFNYNIVGVVRTWMQTRDLVWLG